MNDNSNPTLGEFLQAAREAKQLSLRAVEKASGVSNAYLSQVESGKIKQPSPSILHKLSDLYEVSYADVLTLAGHPVPNESASSDHSPRPLDRLGIITPDEEQELVEYLVFLRSRKGRKD